ncbi:hypothetical protein ACFVIM_20025 [Streptomyces sp. NPDC057638]|uniref:hypothetical protein n=1 Tax=Streptomyces sp. NPDC057638 TaxID=3346190 RepID=UPI00367DE267
MSSSIPPPLRVALQNLRQVRSVKPQVGIETEEFAAWREQIAEALEALALVLIFPEDRERAADEAKAARAEARRIRSRLDIPS